MGITKMAKTTRKVRANGSRVKVMNGSAKHTVGGLTKAQLKKNKSGKYVSKKASARGKQNKWAKACAKARKQLKIKGFVLINRGAVGKALYKRAKEIYGQ